MTPIKKFQAVALQKRSLRLLRGFCLIFLPYASQTKAATTAIGTVAHDRNNFASFTGVTLDSVTLAGTEYLTSELTQITMTAFQGGSNGQILATNNSSLTLSETQRRDFIETDWRADTGLINPSPTVGAFQADFNSPVTNIVGVDMVFFELSSTSNGDEFTLTINGTNVVVGSTGSYGNTAAITSSADLLNLSMPVANLDQLLTENLSNSSPNISLLVLGIGIDFSDFGVAEGETVSSFSLRSGGSFVDPVIIAAVPAAIPEPTTAAALFFSLVALATRRRR